MTDLFQEEQTKIVIDLFIEGEPVPQPRPRVFVMPGAKFASVATDNKQSKGWKKIVSDAVFMWLYKRDLPKPLYDRHQAVTVDMYFILPTLKSVKREWPTTGADVDNLAKAVMDCLAPKKARKPENRKPGLVWHDDSQVVDLHIHKRFSKHPGNDVPGLSITIKPVRAINV